MSTIVFATFESKAAADQVAATLVHDFGSDGPLSVQVHAEWLDPLSLPEDATTTGRIYGVAMGAGALIGSVMAVLAELIVDLVGLTVGSAAMLGALAGTLIGMLTALMQGVRAPKPPLALAARALSKGRALITVVARHGDEVVPLENSMIEAGAIEFGRC